MKYACCVYKKVKVNAEVEQHSLKWRLNLPYAPVEHC